MPPAPVFDYFSTSMARSDAPIFVVGSPRSGTSILTRCLGQHPNIMPIEESVWFSRLALTLQSCYEEGSARGERSQLSAMGISRDQLFRTVGDAINGMILRQREIYEANGAEIALARGVQADPAFLLARNSRDPKGRWVDGTPEYSLSMFGLRSLFPDARFIHVLRDVRAVVRSLMRFSDSSGNQLVKTEDEAYQYWLRTTRACVAAQRAFGPEVVRRVRYSELLAAPEASLRSCLEFLGETFSADCLMPLKERSTARTCPLSSTRKTSAPTRRCARRATNSSKRSRRKNLPRSARRKRRCSLRPNSRSKPILSPGPSTKW